MNASATFHLYTDVTLRMVYIARHVSALAYRLLLLCSAAMLGEISEINISHLPHSSLRCLTKSRWAPSVPAVFLTYDRTGHHLPSLCARRVSLDFPSSPVSEWSLVAVVELLHRMLSTRGILSVLLDKHDFQSGRRRHASERAELALKMYIDT